MSRKPRFFSTGILKGSDFSRNALYAAALVGGPMAGASAAWWTGLRQGRASRR